MKSMDGFFEKTLDQRIYQKLLEASQSHNLTECLIAMQTDRGIDAAQARENADLCISNVAQWESIHDRALENVEDVADLLLDSLRGKNEAEQKLILHKLYFGLTEFPQEREDESLNERFWRYYVEQKDQKKAPSNAELENMIRRKLKNFRLSPDTMRAVARKMEFSGEHLATAAALGENGYSFKCLAAMELYLNERNGSDPISIPEAVNEACAGVETQAVGDAVSKGFLTRDTAKKLLIAAAITAAVVGIAYIAFGIGAGAAVQSTVTAMAGAESSGLLVPLPEVFAEFATAYTAAGEPATLISLMDAMGGTIEAQKKAAFAKKIIGTAVLASGAAMAALSDKTAALIGNISTGLASMRGKNAASNAQGLHSLEYDEECWEAGHEEHISREELYEEEQNLNAQALLY